MNHVTEQNFGYCFDEHNIFTNKTRPYSVDPRESEIAGKKMFTVYPRSTPKKPPKAKDGEVQRYNSKSGEWQVIKDSRGIYYNKETGDRVTILDAGKTPDKNLTPKEYPGAGYKFDEGEDDWIIDIEKERQSAIQVIEDEYNYILDFIDKIDRVKSDPDILTNAIGKIDKAKTVEDIRAVKL